MSDRPTPTDAQLETQRATAALISAIDVPAPASLHAAVRELTERGVGGHVDRTRREWSPRPLLAGAVACAAALIAVLVLALSGGSESAPTVQQASVLAQRPATQPAPAEIPGTPERLAISAAGISYPYWGHFGLQAVGARGDRLGGRAVTTVFYSSSRAPSAQRDGLQIGYSIVDGPALAIPTAGRSIVWNGVRYQVLRYQGSTVVTWRRSGHTCILVGARVSSRKLLTLADWQAT
jgi:hypothetical protein